MEIMKIYTLIFSFLLLGFIIRGIAERISIIITTKKYFKKFEMGASQGGKKDN